MKKYIFIWLNKCLMGVVFLVIFSSCSEDRLTETPLDFISPEVAYINIEGIQQGINGLHIIVRERFYYGTNQILLGFLWGLGTDVIRFGDDPYSTRWLTDYKLNVNSSDLNYANLWTWNYELIQRANVLIQGINDANEDIWISAAEKNSYLAEAMFFRAWAYRSLVTFYGDVPLVREVIGSPKTDFVRAPKTEIYKQMEEDLIFASANLPEPGQEDAPGRITQGVAWHFLSELYLTEGKYELAVNAASKVIDEYNYALMTSRFGGRQNVIFNSEDVFYDLFGYGNHNLAGNTEAIWVIQFEPYIAGGGRNGGERWWTPAYFRVGNTPDGYRAIRGEFVNGIYTGYSDTLGRGVAFFRPTNYTVYDIWQSDWDNDIRNAPHNIKRDFYYDSPQSAFHGKKIDFSLYPQGSRDALRDTNQYIYPYWMKFGDPGNHFGEESRSGAGFTHKDIYAVRLAETLLLRAEAYVRLNNLNAAAQDINLIRTRAKATPVSPANVNMDYICDERARELYGEEWRHMTLRRTGKMVERVWEYNDNPGNPGVGMQEHHVLLPIPQAVLDLNIGAEMLQNPGYD